jgi:hypothetical protein
VRTSHLLAATCPALAVLAFAPAVPVLSPLLCLAAVAVIGELWLRALIREPPPPVARLGLAAVAGLVSLPLVAMALHVASLRIERRGLAAGLAVLATALTVIACKRPVEHRGVTRSRRLSTVAAVGVPAALALVIGGTATLVYQRLPHPAEPGYTSLALAGWAAGIARPVVIPRAGIEVPLELSSAGEQPRTAGLLVRIGGRPTGPVRPLEITPGTRPLRVHVPAPADGCLHPIRISVGATGTVFYGRGPSPC